MKHFLLATLFTVGTSFLNAQNPSQPRICGTGELPQQFETWVKSITPVASSSKLGSSNIQSVFNIPVIVHVIHNNEALNSVSATSGNNLNAAQIIDQINILNEDFNGLNPDTNLIPTVFKPLLGKFQINFCLAVVNPTGGILAEPGIDRINRVTKGWSAPPYSITYTDGTIKPNSIWDPNRYLNIWVASMSGGLLGYATFPNPGTSGLSGLSGSFGTLTSDGVVIQSTAFGSIGTGQFGQYDQGRTTTHEIGHWLGLRHIWGDGTCATDYVNDTPPHQTANYNCPSFPYKLGTCSGNTTGEMTMNYMDYTNDACMYMFTKDQKVRAQLILVNSPIRAALITSTICNLPSVGNDVGISFVARPTYSQSINCLNYIDPIINITNFGSTPVTSFTVTYNVNGVNTQTMAWTGSVNPSASFTLAIPQISGLVNGTHTFSVNISNPNGGTDNNLSNNNNIQNFTLANIMNVSLPTQTICAGTSAVLTASGAVNYSWAPGVTTSTYLVSPNITTSYSVSASNSACTVVKTTTVFVIASPTLVTNGATVCVGTPTVLTVSGAPSFTWANGSTSNSISVTPFSNTVITVSGTNSLGCISTASALVNMLTTPTVAVNDVTVCAGGTATLFASGANNYTWSTGSTASSATTAPASFSVYTLSGFIGSCVHTRTVSVSIGSALSVFINPINPEICFGNSTTLIASGANTYTWTGGISTNTLSVSPLVTTTYTVLALAGTCPGSQVITVTVNALPQTVISSSNVLCFGGNSGQISASSTGNGPFTYTYSSGPNNLQAGVYTVTTLDAKGCLQQNTVAVSQPAQLSSQASTGGDTRCPLACNGTAQVQASGGTAPYTGTLYPNGNTASSFTNLCAGNYSYITTDANGCQSSTNFVINAGNNGIQITSTVTHVSCSSCSDATLTASSLTGTGPFSFTWNPGNLVSASYVNAGVGCYTLTAADAEGCSAESVLCVTYDVGIDQLDLNSRIDLVPNPVSGIAELTLSFEGSKFIRIYDARGRLIRDLQTEDQSLQLDVAGYSQGLYYIQVYSSKGTGVVKLVKD